MGTRTLCIALLIASPSYLAAPAAADSLDDDRFSLSLGVFITDRDTDTELDGSLVDLYADIDYRVLNNLSVGFGINSVNLDVDTTKSGFKGALDWRYSGALVFLKFDF